MKLPDVILLNGTSSSGKSAIAGMLQARLPLVRMGIDDFVWERVPATWYDAVRVFLRGPHRVPGAPIDYANEPIKIFRAFHRAVRVCVAEGIGVVVDDAIVTRELLDDWVMALEGVDVFFVGVHCDTEELVLREWARRDRTPGTAVGGLKHVHAYAIYDLEIDSTTTPSSALAAQIIAAVQARSGSSAFERLRVASRHIPS
ncbi:MAG: AAA family ATPase [Alphaproteobacteria bacterium]|nr:AAA family ATPase [Alphaproteobacteria bacterium]MBL6936432.1 AAA family ATPase [Alphaproteobacteria bacterium]MBL7098517.1 AAA family ATPase [Alphaproteobacteria bacterium]